MEKNAPGVSRGDLWNEDLAPTDERHRTWSRWNLAALWIGMSVCVTTYTLAAGLLKIGMTWWQAVLTILLGNLIVLVPMVLNGHPGTRYGIPFPVLIRASFGTRGSNVPALARAIVACGWFGIQTWIGGAAIYELLAVFFPEWRSLGKIGFLGISQAELGCFLGFWLMNLWFIVRGTESIRWLESLAAPFLILIGVALLGWGIRVGGGLGQVLAQSEHFGRPSVEIRSEGPPAIVALGPHRATRWRVDGGPWAPLAVEGRERGVSIPVELPASPKPLAERRIQFADEAGHVSSEIAPSAPPGADFWKLFLPALTAMVGYWATLSLNIPDFTRFARSQKDQILGQLYGLPTTMAFYSFIGIAVTCASLLAFPDILVQEDAPWDPVRLLGRFHSAPLVIGSMIALIVATLTTNIAANVVSPANDFSNAAPRWVSYRTGGLLTAAIGVLIMPWKLIESTHGYIFTWLIGYGALLGPIAGIMIADYFIVRRARLEIGDLYRSDGRYGRWNGRTIAVLLLAVLPCVPGFLVEAGFLGGEGVPEALRTIYTYAWFVGFAIAFVLHTLVARREKTSWHA
jgi:cytosine/uracil/thiamine/allantoin permease